MRIGMMFSLMLVAFLLGCSNEPAPVTQTPGPPPVKAALEQIANTGEMGSGMMEVEQGLNELKKTDAAKADKLLKEYSELQLAKDPADVKAKAKAMADQL